MKKITLHTVSLFALLLLMGCGISDDCFKGNGQPIVQTFPFDNFTKIKVHDGVGLVVKEGPDYEVKVSSSTKIMDNLEVKLEGTTLVVKDLSTCNIARDYGQTIVHVTLPDGSITPLIQELELHCKTEQKIQSEGTLHSPIIRLFSIDVSDGAGTGDFILAVDNGQVVVESNNVSNFYITGHCNEMLLNFYFGNGRFEGTALQAETIKVYHRGSNDLFVYPVQHIEGKIVATGNVILKNNPPIVNVEELFTGKVIF